MIENMTTIDSDKLDFKKSKHWSFQEQKCDGFVTIKVSLVPILGVKHLSASHQYLNDDFKSEIFQHQLGSSPAPLSLLCGVRLYVLVFRQGS